ncbi:Vacuolar protein sorting-associated protein 35 [Spathaspora sp. JA1]|nr:Vacuolar protein sorting-associated protein 35 [Spathaspora sp. JA1]
MLIFDSLEILSIYLSNSHNSKQSKLMKAKASEETQTPFLADLYEIVQYSGNIIPRLYLMIVVGTTYMSTKGAPSKELMKDMIEMCHGVQHPIRGLFLRYYLSQRIKNLLPFSTPADFHDTVEFLIANFIEMNKLWVRLQHQGHSSERELRYQERKELKILVGSNLVRLSQVIDDYKGEEDEQYSSTKFYHDKVFPTITEQIIQCRDHLAQTYLIDVLIQIFPDDFHFATLDQLLNDVFLNLNPLLKKSELVTTLIDRFISYKKFSVDSSDDKEKSSSNNDVEKLFSRFWSFYLKLNQLEPTLPPEEHSTLLQSFISLSLTFDPENFENLDIVYKYATNELTNEENSTQVQEEMWVQLLTAPIRHFTSIKTLFKLEFFYEFYLKLNKEFQTKISLAIVNKMLSIENDDNTSNDFEYLSNTTEIDGIFKYLLVLIKDKPVKVNTATNLGILRTIKINNGEKQITPEFIETQEKICKIIHLVEIPNDPLKTIAQLMYIRKKYLNKEAGNLIYTYPTLISRILFKLKLVGYVNLEQKKRDQNDDSLDLLITSNFKNLSIIIDELYLHHQEFSADVILNIYLKVATVADQLRQESICYELFTQCFVVYEENIILNSHQYKYYTHMSPHDVLGGSLSYQGVVAIANALTKTRFFTKENYENLITKVTLYGSKLLKKQDQCRSVYYCAHLWWWSETLLPPGEKTATVESSKKDKKKETENNEEEDPEKVSHEEEDEVLLYRDGKRVLECLQKSLRVADSCMDPYLSLKLFIEILSRCLIFNVYGNGHVDSRYINGLIDLIKTNIENLRDDEQGEAEEEDNTGANEEEEEKEAVLFKSSQKVFERTLKYISQQQETEGRFEGIIV